MAFTKANQRLARLAAMVHAHLAAQPRIAPVEKLPEAVWQTCTEELTRLRLAIHRGWDTTADAALRDLSQSLQRLARDANNLITQLAARPPARIGSPHDIYHDLVALEEEFAGRVTWSRRESRVSVETEPIDLEGIYLGAFRIDLLLAKKHLDHPYRVVALDPHPATKNDSITHPHVQSEQLCEGDGRSAIRAALASGRLYDFFQLVTSILNTYNSGSPYVALEDWSGVSCTDCDATVYDDEAYTCSRCDCHLCGECERCCSACSESLCGECSDSCARCGDTLCRSCASQCAECSATCCSSCFHDDDERCDPCHAENQENSEAEGVPASAAV